MTRLVECVPNFSEGRDRETVRALEQAVEGVPEVALFDSTADPDHNRCVLTFAGPPEAVSDAVIAAVRVARDRIDLTDHSGVHPRLGAADVIPFVPLRELDMEDCAALAARTGGRIWSELGIPVYLYEAAARRPERKRLENVRRGRFELIRSASHSDPSRAPDIGGPGLHATAGASIVGARKFLVAWNVNLTSHDVEVARRIARAIRESSGGLPHVKALGFELASRGHAQVSINLTDHNATPIGSVYARIIQEASAAGVGIEDAELIGLIPLEAWQDARRAGIPFRNFGPDRVVEERIKAL